MGVLTFRLSILRHQAVNAGLRAFALALLALLLFSPAASGQMSTVGETPLEYSVKGAYLLKFIGFVEWPPGAFASPDAPLVITVLGDDPFGPVLDRMAEGQMAGGRPVDIRRTYRIDQTRDAHILFISQSEEARMDIVQASLRDRNVLTVADFNRPGVIISFAMQGNKVRFEINLDQAQRAGLKLNSRLLAVATTVHGK